MSDASAALLVIDVQNDFCAGGALEVPDGDSVVPPINRLLAASNAAGRPVFASRDWHPLRSIHFKERGGDWPVHCVAGTVGAAFHPGLRLDPAAIIVTKGTAPDADGYSAFDGVTTTGTPLADALTALGVRRLLVCGLATDYCVRASVIDARRRGFDVSVVGDAIAAVNLAATDGDAAVQAMRAAGADVVHTDDAVVLLEDASE